MKQPSGFTLVELMIVIAIVGILTAIAVPAYRDYSIRAKVTECVTMLAACKPSYAEFYAEHGVFPSSAAQMGCSTSGSPYCDPPHYSALPNTVGIAVLPAATGLANKCYIWMTANAAGGVINYRTGANCPPQYLPSSFR